MPFHFTCPYCYKKTLVDDALAGKSGLCAGCAKSIVIPEAPSQDPENMTPVGSEYVAKAENNQTRRYLTYVMQGVVLLVLIGVTTAVVTYFLWPTFNQLRDRRNKTACLNNLQLIASALNEYSSKYGTYPPSIVYDDTGKPMHSWRVLILPELGYPALYDNYDFNTPWDSEHNANFMMQCPEEYISPAADNHTGNEGTYFLITGKGTIFPKGAPLGQKEITDGRHNTLLVVESENSAGEWTKPQDIEFAKLNRQIGAQGANAIGGNHNKGATAVMADGTPVWLPDDLDPVLLDAMISPAAKDEIDVSPVIVQ